MLSKSSQIIVLLVIVLCIPACQSRSELKTRLAMLKFGLLYIDFNHENGRSPSSLAELKTFSPESRQLKTNEKEMLDSVFKMIEDGNLIVIWNAKLTKSGDLNAICTLAYETTAPSTGGLIIDGGGAVHRVTSEEFAQRPKIAVED